MSVHDTIARDRALEGNRRTSISADDTVPEAKLSPQPPRSDTSKFALVFTVRAYNNNRAICAIRGSVSTSSNYFVIFHYSRSTRIVLVTSLFTITIVLLYEYCTVLFVSSVAFDSQANSQEFAVSKNCQTQTFEPAAHLPTGTGRIDHAERRNVAWTAVSFPGRLRLSIQPHD